MLFKCKMCGGDLDINQEMKICECQYCGSKQTLPKLGDDKRNNMLDRAGHFRRNNEYDKAMSLYEQILNEESEDAEVYWSMVLCRYGIEYVEDPSSHRRMPTINRMQYNSILSDADYNAALKYADAQQRIIYEDEAKEIDRIQKGILAISNKEEPFDVFICYKESDANGRRTPDSVLANDLYHQLTQEGFKVFFARITLEDKLGSAYEPYIFAALNSAKVMVVLGTKPEYFNAVWVKNEWSRYLSMMKGGAQKVLIPAYRDMDPYDLPEAFSHLQAQDMSKLGFMQDLIRGIKKLTDTKKETRPIEIVGVGSGAHALVERAFLCLEDGDFTKADELCEQALNQDPKNALAYVGKLMVEKKVRKQEELSKGTDLLSANNYFQKAVKFAEDGLRAELERCNQMVFDNKKDKEYISASDLIRQSNTSATVATAINLLNQAIGKYNELAGWRESESKIAECQEKKKTLINSAYEKGKKLQEESDEKKLPVGEIIRKLEDAIEYYNSIAGFTNVKVDIESCQDKLNDLYKIREKEKNQRRVCTFVSVTIVIIVLIVVGNITIQRIAREKKYEEAYAQVLLAVEEKDYIKALTAAEGVLEQEDVDKLFCKLAKEKLDEGKYVEALDLVECIPECEDAEEIINEATYQRAKTSMDAGDYAVALIFFSDIIEYKDVEELIKETKYQYAIESTRNFDYLKAIQLYEEIPDYADSAERMEDLRTRLDFINRR